MRKLWVSFLLIPHWLFVAEPQLHAEGEGHMFHRVLFGATSLATNEWDWVAEAGFTLVESYGSDLVYFRWMLDQAQQRGLKMISDNQGWMRSRTWLTLEVDTNAVGAVTAVWPHVVHHFSVDRPALILYGDGVAGLKEGIEVPLGSPGFQTVDQVAAHLNGLGGGIRATVAFGKGGMAAAYLGPGWFGNAAAGPVGLSGAELDSAAYEHFVGIIQDHPALHCFAPFDDTDLGLFSRSFQHDVRERLRKWAPNVPAYLLVSSEGLTPGTFAHDHKIAPEAYDGVITYVYPYDWESSGTYLELEAQRYLLRQWWSVHGRGRPSDLLVLCSAFKDGPWTTPPGAIDWQWQATRRSDVPLAGFGYWVWHGGNWMAEMISKTPRLREETSALNKRLAAEYMQLSVVANQRRFENNSAVVAFTASLRGGDLPTVCEWDFGDGTRGWGMEVNHGFSGPGTYVVKATVVARSGGSATSTTRILVTGESRSLWESAFGEGQALGLKVAAGDWELREGAYRQTNTNAAEARCYVETPARLQYSVDADFRLTGDQDRMWLIYAGAATGSDRRVTIEPLQSAAFAREGLTVALRLRADDGVTTTWLPWVRGQLYRLTVDVAGNRVWVSVDGQLVLEGDFTAAAADVTVGIGMTGTAGECSRLRVGSIDPIATQVAVTRTGSRQFSFSPGVLGGTGPLEHAWTYGDGTGSAEPFPHHDYANNGVYEVGLRVTNNNNGVVVSEKKTILMGGELFYREAEDYDWRSDAGAVEYPTNAVSGIQYAAGRTGRNGTDFRQASKGRGNANDWRDPGEVSLYRGEDGSSIRIGSTSPGDWWNYSFSFPAAGMIKLRAWMASANPVRCRVFWRDRPLFDLLLPGNGWDSAGWIESPVAPVDGRPGWLRFVILDGTPGGTLDFDRFEVEFIAAVDSDNDGLADVADADDDGDGFLDADELTGDQSHPGNKDSVPTDLDGDHLSDANDPDKDGDGLENEVDPFPLIANHAPIIVDPGPQEAYVGELFRLSVRALDRDTPTQQLVFALEDAVPSGAAMSSDGLLTWTPQAVDAQSTVRVTVSVTDSGQAPRTVFHSFPIYVAKRMVVAPGFARVEIETTNGPVSLVVPRRRIELATTGRTLYLAKDGNDSNSGTLSQPWRSFARAISSLTAGDLLYVRGGDYSEPFTISRSGTQLKPIILSAYPGERVRLFKPSGWQEANPHRGTVRFDWDCRHVWFHGFEVHGGGSPGTPYVSDYGRCCLELNGGNHAGLRILNNLLWQAYDAGLKAEFITPKGECLIEGNVVWECGSPMGAGILISSSKGGGMIVRGNTVYNSGNGIVLQDVEGISLYDNQTIGSSESGMLLTQNVRNSTVAHNLIGLGRTGLTLDQSSRTNRFANNLFAANWLEHLALQGAAEIATDRSTFDTAAFDVSTKLASPEEWFIPWLGTNHVFADPGVADANALDFRLRSESPCRNRASSIAMLGALPQHDVGLFPATDYWEPELSPLPSQEIVEQSELRLSLPLARTNPLATRVFYQVMGVLPNGANFDTNSALLTWVPGELQGPGVYTLRIQTVADDSPLLVSTTTLTINVAEVNNNPTLMGPADPILKELAPAVVILNALDEDFPANHLTFETLSGPDGLSIDPTGKIRWTPTEAQGPSTNTVTVQVTDDGTPSLSATHSFQIVVQEVNSPPMLTVVDQAIQEDEPFTLNLAATDADLPMQTLAYELVSGPEGLTVDAGGALHWNPTEAQGPSTHTVTVRVADNWTPSLSTSNTFQVVVQEVNSPPTLTVADQAIEESEPFTLNLAATDVDLPRQPLAYQLVSGPEGLTVDVGGALRWNPTEAQGPNTHTVTVKVTDNGTPSLSVASTFRIAVSEANSAPALKHIEQVTAMPGVRLEFPVEASDSDLPPQELVFTLDAGAPSGAGLTPEGMFVWTPTVFQSPSTNHITVRVQDAGAPPLSVSATFVVVVMDSSPVKLADLRYEEGRFSLKAMVPKGARFALQASADLQTWWNVLESTGTGEEMLLSDGSAPSNRRYYRLRMEP